jgi:diguanylate cyclase (GGDEF)-like protein
LEQEWYRSVRNQVNLAFMMMDIDYFKNYNDTHGHVQGDRALRAVAQIIKTSLSRAIDKAARWGGEEFSVILPETHLSGARIVAERIRSNVEYIELPLTDGTRTRVTLSIGVHCVVPRHSDEYQLKDLVSDTDKALYYAKSTGRNCVRAADDLPAEIREREESEDA